MNPVEFEGTFPLPEAQLDRFLVKIALGEIDLESEQAVIARFVAGFEPWSLEASGMTACVDQSMLSKLQRTVGQTSVDPAVQAYLVEIIRRTRSDSAVLLGASTRAGVGLLAAARAHARLNGRDFVIPDDVKCLAPYVLAHRVVVRPEAQLEGIDGTTVVNDVLHQTPVPRTTAG